MTYKWNRKYYIEDEYLKPKDFSWCVNYFKNNTTFADKNQKKILISKNKIYTNGKIECDKEHMKSIYDNINHKAIRYLKQLAPDRIDKVNYTEMNFVRLNSKNDFHIHPDIHQKLCSIVIYIAPRQSTGTFLYKNQKGDSPYEVTWKQNRALIFCRHDDTWHSYKNPHNEPRDCLVYNLIS
jgi:hypothetical protein